ncbi:DUF2637 domain-containing protein [Streptomyces sp. ISL-36]|uniref:DUF2637 domain-containing protein n=1 Tax=Streptomyces sp. ISL-36 TaxID=2819182 RepID=UPI001BECD641|nr:DUF2637 domain-containing protein [Streptomyces sp. ISL-36]MBT2439834.1 DUF2637 domain-containing protein [Streptomyces sp. ISL-36]
MKQIREGRQHVTAKTTKPVLTRAHRVLISVVVAGAVIIAAIGFAGSYAAVRELAVQKGFGDFSLVFPIGIDAGICVLLALDLLLTWLRIPFPLLRQTAWLLTAATIAFNGAASWPDPLGVGMHAVIPVLFVVAVEAARHAVGRIADITADKHMEGVRLTRWLLSPLPTFLLWRRMKLWEIRSYEQAVRLEQHRLVYEAQLQAQYGRRWRRKAPVEALMPLRLARYGVPLAETAPHVLEEAGLDLSAAVTMERADGQVAAEPAAGEHQRALDAGQREAARHKVSKVEEQLPETEPAAAPQDIVDAGQAAAEPVTDRWPATPHLTDDRPAVADDVGVLPGRDDLVERQAVAEPHPFFEPSTPQPLTAPAPPMVDEPYVSEPVAAPTAAVAGEHRAGGGVPEQTSLELPSARSAEPSGEPTVWESTVTDAGAATARLPEQQTDEPELDPVQQQIVTVAEWLIEAEEVEGKLSGAEVARRLGLSPRTGQRRLDKAAEYLAEQRRQQGRAHLRSVRS